MHTSSLQWRLSLPVVAGLAVAAAMFSAALLFPGSASAAAPNGFTSQTYQDSDSNGTIDRLVVVINGGEALTACTVTAGELSTDWTYVGGATFGGTLASATCDTASATITFVISGATAGVTGGGTAPTIAYDNDDADNSIANASGNLGTVAAQTAADGAKPQIKTATYSDADGDGKIDTLTMTYTETVTAASVLRHADLTLTGVGDFTALAFGSATTDLITGSVTSTAITMGTESSAVDTRENAGTIAFSSQANFSLTDGTNTNSTLGAQSQVTFVDNAAPVVVSVTPTDSSSTSRTSNVTATFSESMDTTFAHGTEFSLSPILPNSGTWSVSWASSDTVVTLNPSVNLACSQNYTMTLATSDIDAAAGSTTDLVNTGPHDGVWTFRSRGCEVNDDDTVVVKTYALALTSPNGGESWKAGERHLITWDTTTTGNGTVPFANLSYSLNGGADVAIISNIPNTGTYEWTVPNIAGSVKITVAGTDLATVLATDSSNAAFTVTNGTTVVTPDEEEDVPAETPVEEPENNSPYATGTLVRMSGSSTIYYIDATGSRRPFYNSTIFYTWADSFEDVEVISASDMADLPMGAPMVPKAGTTLVKVESVAKVYALETDENGGIALRWITSEEAARSLYGSAWSDYVIDIPVTLFTRFSMGEDVDSDADITVDRSIMHTRMHLSR